LNLFKKLFYSGSGSGSSTIVGSDSDSTAGSNSSTTVGSYNLSQINTEDVEHTKHEEDLLKQTNIDSRYGCLSSNINLFHQSLFGHNDTFV